MPEAMKKVLARRLLTRVAEAYGRMLLLQGLFQADCHPGNILVKGNGGIGVHVTPLLVQYSRLMVELFTFVARFSNGRRTGLAAAFTFASGNWRR